MAALPGLAGADPQHPRFQHLGQDDGLSQSMVYAIAQDTAGFMWFGTQDGLNRFDGYDFVVHAPSRGEPGSLADESIRDLLVGKDGTLWVATDAGGLSRYDAGSNSFRTYHHDPSLADSLGSDRVRTVFEDSRGRLWVGTDGAGLARLDRSTNTFEHYRHDPGSAMSLSDDRVWSIAEDGVGAIWVATTNGLNRFDPDGSAVERFVHVPEDPASLSNDEVRVLLVDRQKNLWIGTAAGLNRFDQHNGVFERFRAAEDDPASLSADRINTLYQDKSGILWIGTVGGLNAWNPVTRTFTRYQNNPADPFSLPHNTVTSIYQDRAGVLWIGSYTGVSRWSPSARAMRYFHSSPDDPASLSENTVTSFAEDPAGNIVVGTFGGGISILDRSIGTFSQLRHDEADDSSLSSDHVMALHYDSEGNLWAGTRAAGLNRIDAQSGRIERFVHDPADPVSISSDTIAQVLEGRSGGLWIATFGGGLNYYDGTKFRRYRHDPDDPQSLSSDRVLVLHEDAAGGIWAGTYAAGLNYLDPVTGRFARYSADANDESSLGDNGITMIQEDPEGNLWIGVKGAGLHVWRREDRESGKVAFDRYTEKDGLPNATIYSGQWDSTGHLWLSTGRGLSRLEPESMAFRSFDLSHGIQGYEYNLNAGFRARNGEMFFGGMNGFNSFQPSSINAGGPPPEVVITRATVFNEDIDFPKAAVGGGNGMQFRHDENLIGFEYAALDFAAPDKTRYEYRLQGADPQWVDAGKRRYVTYSKLPPGKYEFRVRAINNDGIRSAADTVVSFVVRPAPWATPWAYAAYALLLLAGFAFVVSRQARRAREAEMVRHAAEVHRLQGRLANAQQIASLGNWEWNLKNGSIWWSDQVYRLLGLSREEFAGTYAGFLERVHPGDRAALEKAIGNAVENRNGFELDHRIVWPDGRTRHVSERAAFIAAGAGKPACLSVTMQDISERVSAEDTLRQHAEFHEVLAGFSATLLHAEAQDVDEEITTGLARIGQRYAVDEIAVRWFSDDPTELATSHYWTKTDTRRKPNGLDAGKLHWTVEMLRSGNNVVVNDIDAFPVSQPGDEAEFRKRGYRSLLMVPLRIDGKLSGVCQFSTRGAKRAWPESTVTEFGLVCDVIASALARQCAMTEVMSLKDELQAENLYLREEVKLAHGFAGIIGEDAELRRCLQAVEKVAPTDVPVLVLGETGTGKELIARAIHNLSARADGPMVSVNCPALPGTLIESELFGHEKGAFTGADSSRKGRFEIAEGGTIFLDEIGELPMDLQAKLLRVLQTGEFERLGSTKTLQANVRLVAATNRNLSQRIKQGEFRADLFFRISSFPIHLPPLRNRKGDIPLLAEHFVYKHAQRLGRNVSAISVRFLKQLEKYEWPGNVRELESTIERALITCMDDEVLDMDGPVRAVRMSEDGFVDLKVPEDADLADIERTYILSVLERTDGRISGDEGAADVLGVPASTLRSKIKKLGIDRDQSS